MKFEVTKILFAEKANPPKIEVHVSFREEKQTFAQGGSLNVYLDWQDYTISQIKVEAMEAAKKLLKAASSRNKPSQKSGGK